jgi:hypothetical protein
MKKEHSDQWIRFDKMCQDLGTDQFLIRSFCIARAAKDKDKDKDYDEDKRSIIFNVSTSGMKRDGHEIDQNGWDLTNFRANPVIMWAHRYDGPPIANSLWEKVMNSPASGGKLLRSEGSFISAELSPFADNIYQMYVQRILNAVSAGWRSLEYEYRKDDEGYITGIIFKKMDLLEYSCVPIPADPKALQRGVQEGFIKNVDDFDVSKMLRTNEAPVFWLGLSEPATERKIIVDESRGHIDPRVEEAIDADDRGGVAHKKYTMKSKDVVWDGAGARKRLATWAKEGETTDFTKYRAGFLWYDTENANKFGAYKGPHHDVSGGAVVTVPRGVYAVAQRLQQGAFSVPTSDVSGMKTHIAKHYHELDEKAPWERTLGTMYEQVHSALRVEGLGEVECELLRGTAVSLATQLYGEDRLPESWESQYGCADDTILNSLAGALENVFMESVADIDAFRDMVNTVLDETARSLEGLYQQQDVLEEVIALVGTDDVMPVLTQAIQLYQAAQAHSHSRVDTILTKLQSETTPKENKENSENLLTDNTDSDLLTLFREILSDSPVAGVDDDKKI